MARYFFDTSAIVKHFHREAGSEMVASLFNETGSLVLLSSLGLLEIQSAFAVKVRSGVLKHDDAQMMRVNLILDVAAGEIEVYSVTSDHFRDAEHLIRRHAFTERLRTLDALQLAVALDLFDQGEMDIFVVSDAILGRVANLEGLNVIVP